MKLNAKYVVSIVSRGIELRIVDIAADRQRILPLTLFLLLIMFFPLPSQLWLKGHRRHVTQCRLPG